ncbi:MAG: sulfatase-like hydrolase/transferase [Deltaproteobacteria bacterium]|nr:sulfatase-like hydrolase/transferase [Deltaproteobacteria bacterium]
MKALSRPAWPRFHLASLTVAGVLSILGPEGVASEIVEPRGPSARVSKAPASSSSSSEGPSSGAGPSKANVLLITIDTLRPDALGWASGRVGKASPTPEIDVLASEGVRFPAAVSPVPITLPAHTTLMTGWLPRRHGVRDNGQLVAAEPRTLAERLQGAGYATAAFVSGFPLSSQFGLDRGFGHYDDTFLQGSGPLLERSAKETTAAALAWLETAKEPWMMWVHYFDPHDPYEPPEAFRRTGARGAYDGEVAYTDSQLGDLRRGVAGKATSPLLTVFAADHGESLGEHGETTHGFFLYDSTILVPLIFHAPERLSPKEGTEARLVDVAPTVLELLDLAPLEDTDGVSLLPSLEGRPQEVPGAYVETRRPWISYGWSPLTAFRKDSWKLIVAPRPELYDLTVDSGEGTNLIDEARPRARQLQASMRQVEAKPEASSQASGDPETVARLRALGYTGAGASSRQAIPQGLADPKDRLHLWNTLGEAEGKLAAGDAAAASALFDQVVKEDPNNPFALARSGSTLLERGDAKGAIARLEKAVSLDPDGPEIRLALAHAFIQEKRLPEAEQQWMELLRLQPRREEAWVNLGNTLGMQGKGKEAVGAFQRAVEIDSENPQYRARLAFAEFSAGQYAEAAEHLEQTASMVPDGTFPHAASLGLIYLKLGNLARARNWFVLSRPSESDFALGRIELARLELQGGNRALAQRAVREAVRAAPALRQRVEADRLLGPLLR